MSVPVTITLNSIVGTPGPFNLYSCTGVTCAGTPFETGVSLVSLQGGYGTNLAPNGTTNIKIVSTGCSYEITKPITGSPTPTPTNTPTSTPTNTPTPTPTLNGPTPTPTPTLPPSFFGIIRTTAPTAPSDCSIGGITYDGSQAVWEFKSSTNQFTTSSVLTDYPMSTYNTLSQFNLIQGQTYYLCDLSYGWTSFVYNGANSITIGMINSCPVSYEFAVYTSTTLSGIGGACTFHSDAVSYVATNGGTMSEYYQYHGGFLIITTHNNNNTLTDSYNPYYLVGYPITVINGDNSTYWIGTDGRYGTFNNQGNFSLGGMCGGNDGGGGGTV